MSNMDEKPQATVCGGEDATAHPNNADGGANGPDGDANVPVELITARDDGSAHAATTQTLHDRGVVFRGPLRAGRRVGEWWHGCRATPSYWAADGELAV